MEKFILVFALFSMIYAADYNAINYKCADKKLKSKMCLIKHDLIEPATSDLDSYEYLIGKHCDDDEECLPGIIGPDQNICINKYKYSLKYGKKCNYNRDCLFGICKDGKCASDKDCGACDKKQACVTQTAKPSKCMNYVDENGSCAANAEGYAPPCAPGYLCNSDNKCTKMFSLGEGKDAKFEYLCQSGFANGGKCVSIKTYPTCESGTCSGKYSDGADIPNTDPDPTITPICNCLKVKGGKYVASISEKRQNYFKDNVVGRFNKIKLDKLKKKKYLDYLNKDAEHTLGDKKLHQSKVIYEHWNEFIARGLIKDNGKKNGDKKCEYKYWMNYYMSSNLLKSSLVSALVLLTLLF